MHRGQVGAVIGAAGQAEAGDAVAGQAGGAAVGKGHLPGIQAGTARAVTSHRRGRFDLGVMRRFLGMGKIGEEGFLLLGGEGKGRHLQVVVLLQQLVGEGVAGLDQLAGITDHRNQPLRVAALRHPGQVRAGRLVAAADGVAGDALLAEEGLPFLGQPGQLRPDRLSNRRGCRQQQHGKQTNTLGNTFLKHRHTSLPAIKAYQKRHNWPTCEKCS
jgi:hypothetical protein